MRLDGDQPVPLRRDWTGWLFVLIAVAAIIGVLYANGEKDGAHYMARPHPVAPPAEVVPDAPPMELAPVTEADARSEEHTSELQSLMRISYAVFCLKKKKKQASITTESCN